MLTLRLTRKVLAAAVVAAPAAAHLSFWTPAMYGFNDGLAHFPFLIEEKPTFEMWWFHNNMHNPPEPGYFFELPAGGVARGQIACGKQYTTYEDQMEEPKDACPEDFASLHEPSVEAATRGTVIAIAYESDPTKIKPEDFVVISVNHTTGYYRDAAYSIPADMPACPADGCHCMWGWVHGQENGGDEFYFTPFKCKVTCAKEGAPKLAAPVPPVPCADDPSKCVKGAKQPIYWGVERGNLPEGHVNDGVPPYYNDMMGYADGAQDGIFEEGSTASYYTKPADPEPSPTAKPKVSDNVVDGVVGSTAPSSTSQAEEEQKTEEAAEKASATESAEPEATSEATSEAAAESPSETAASPSEATSEKPAKCTGKAKRDLRRARWMRDKYSQ